VTAPEPWLRGPLPGVPRELLPAAHALAQAAEDIPRAVLSPAPLASGLLWARPGGAASVGFHLRHVAGSIDRLLTYAAAGALTDTQRAFLGAEGSAEVDPSDAEGLTRLATAAVERAMATIRDTPVERLYEPRAVGRLALPSSVFGLLFHVAEHTQRHVGQIVTTAKVVRGMGAAGGR
jgi:hypothetical protein